MRHSRLILTNPDRIERRGVMAALDTNQCLVWFDPTGRIAEANARMQALVDLPQTRLERMTYQDLMGETGRHDSYFKTHWTRIATGAITSEEREIPLRDRPSLWVSITYAAILDAEGKTRRVLAIVIDLSPWNRSPMEGLSRVY